MIIRLNNSPLAEIHLIGQISSLRDVISYSDAILLYRKIEDFLIPTDDSTRIPKMILGIIEPFIIGLQLMSSVIQILKLKLLVFMLCITCTKMENTHSNLRKAFFSGCKTIKQRS